MYKPDKATTERNAKILRELVKQPDNKLCADCKRNDPRWASWNLGVYLCIRCSGIHRGMGTHISRVKSIDLDMWTPEQMDSIQKWGNRRANLYWEAHLKAGHIPPDHKMESFIRSKYESRRWAMDGPFPADPAVLEGASTHADATPPAPLLDTAPTRATHAPTASLSTPRPSSPSVHSPTTFRHNTASSHAQSRQLLSAAVAGRVQVPPSPSQSQPPPQQIPQDDLFSLDFHAPVSAAAPQPPAKDVKQDILSLFGAPAPTPAVQPSTAFGQFAAAAPSSAWDAQAQQPVSNAGTGHWGGASGWSNTTAPSTNLWGAPAPASTTGALGGLAAGSGTATMANAFNATDIWGGSGPARGATNGLFASQPPPASKKDDVFGDLWGDFK